MVKAIRKTHLKPFDNNFRYKDTLNITLSKNFRTFHFNKTVMNLIKKTALLCVAASGAAFSSYASNAGDIGVGVNIGVAPSVSNHWDSSNFGIGAKLQYNFTDPIRGEFDLNYWCESSHVSAFEMTANVHYLFEASRVFTMYPIVGIGYGRPKFGDHSVNRFVFNLGLGGEFNLSRNWVANIEVKYQYMKDFSRIPMTIGVAYKF